MNIDDTFPLRFWLNAGRAELARHEMEARLEEAHITAERFPAIDWELRGKWSDLLTEFRTINGFNPSKRPHDEQFDTNGYATPAEYTRALTMRIAIREAAIRKSPSVLLIDDETVFHPNFRALIEPIALPDDWEIFYFGCTHRKKPKWVAPRLLRISSALDSFCIAINQKCYRSVMQILNRRGTPAVPRQTAPDLDSTEGNLEYLSAKVPSYACYPNVAWVSARSSANCLEKNIHYESDGKQKHFRTAEMGLLEELVSPIKKSTPIPEQVDNASKRKATLHVGLSKRTDPKIGLLFLINGPVNHPEIWEDFTSEVPEHTRTFYHPKDGQQTSAKFPPGIPVKDHHKTQWGDISLVRASRTLLLAALEDETLTHFVLLSESCVPVRPLSEMLRHLRLDPRPQFRFRVLSEAHPAHAKRIQMVPEIPRGCWHFTPQWWLLDRCTAWISCAQDYTKIFEKMFVPDEAYFATLLSMQGYPLAGNVVNKATTWTKWEKNIGRPIEWRGIPNEVIVSIEQSGSFFARKFLPDSDIGNYNLHRPYRFKI